MYYYVTDLMTSSVLSIYVNDIVVIKLYRCSMYTAFQSSPHPDGPCENGQIKLKNGNKGLLEICVGKQWGPVCDLPEDPFTAFDQQVACFQLGYSGDGVNSTMTTCDHTAWTYDITCDGTEERLLDCAHPEITNAPPRTCTKFENVNLTCPCEYTLY